MLFLVNNLKGEKKTAVAPAYKKNNSQVDLCEFKPIQDYVVRSYPKMPPAVRQFRVEWERVETFREGARKWEDVLMPFLLLARC